MTVPLELKYEWVNVTPWRRANALSTRMRSVTERARGYTAYSAIPSFNIPTGNLSLVVPPITSVPRMPFAADVT